MWYAGVNFCLWASIFFWKIYPFLVYVAAPMVTGAVIVYFTGDDAWQELNGTWHFHDPRFVEVIPNTVYDRYSGLTWIADPGAIGGVWGAALAPASMTFDQAVDECNKLNYGGFNDWRMPNANELQSITDYSKNNPAMDTNTWKAVKNDQYFSGSFTHFGCENFFQGNGGTGGKTWDQDRTKKKYARPVRGKPFPLWSIIQSDYRVEGGKSHRRGK